MQRAPPLMSFIVSILEILLSLLVVRSNFLQSHIYPFNSRLRVKPTVHRELSPSYVKYLITSITVNISPFNIVSTSIVSLWLGLEVFSYLAAHFPLLCTIHH